MRFTVDVLGRLCTLTPMGVQYLQQLQSREY
jgi:hypothetical protein